MEPVIFINCMVALIKESNSVSLSLENKIIGLWDDHFGLEKLLILSIVILIFQFTTDCVFLLSFCAGTHLSDWPREN